MQIQQEREEEEKIIKYNLEKAKKDADFLAEQKYPKNDYL